MARNRAKRLWRTHDGTATLTGVVTEARKIQIQRAILVGFSRALMLPWFRFGRGPRPSRWAGSICVLRTVGRRSGVRREAPLDYAPGSHGIYLLAGLGRRTHWLANVVANPAVEVRFGDRTVAGTASVVTDPGERLRAIRSVLCHCGIVGYCYGFSPFRVSDERLARTTRAVVAVHVRLDEPPMSHLPAAA